MGARLAATARGRSQYWKFLGLLLAVAALGGCTSSDGGSGASPGGGQSPDPVVLDFPIAYVKRPVPTGNALAPTCANCCPSSRAPTSICGTGHRRPRPSAT